MTEEIKAALENLEQAENRLRQLGFSLVRVAASYNAQGAHFNSRLSLDAVLEAGVSEDHILLDMQREIMFLWSDSNHEDKCSMR